MTGRRGSARMLVGAAALLVAAVAARPAAQSLQFTRLGTIPGPSDLVRVDGGHAYIAAAKTLTIFDVAKPEAPRKMGTHAFPEKIWGFRVIGPTAYVAADFYGFAMLDVSNPAAPTLRGVIKTPGQAKNVAIYGTKALVADHMSGVDYLDISNPTQPKKLGSFFLDGYARDVVAAGPLAFAVDSPSGLYVLDLDRPDPIESAVSSLQSASTPSFVEISEPSASPRLVCIVGAGLLQFYDVSNPAMPTKLSTLKTPGRPLRATLKGKFAYVADGPEGLQVVDLSVPATPKIVGSFKTPMPARDVAVDNGIVYVVVGAREEPGEVVVLRQN
ncbi:MAG TPA: hypothetical protein VH417_02145 [Vicinamibacterales bacterium]